MPNRARPRAQDDSSEVDVGLFPSLDPVEGASPQPQAGFQRPTTGPAWGTPTRQGWGA